MNRMILTGICMLVMSCPLNARQSAAQTPYLLGTTKEIAQSVPQPEETLAAKVPSGKQFILRLPGGKPAVVQVVDQRNINGTVYTEGRIPDLPGSHVRLNTNDRELEGTVIMMPERKAYMYYSDLHGRAFVKETDIDELICIDLPVVPEQEKEADAGLQPKINILADVSNLQSFPGAGGCLLLDFDGFNMPAGNGWNNGNAINAAPSGMTSNAIQEAWEIVSEDFRPFNLNVTTNEAVYNSYPLHKRQRCVITPTNFFATGYGGIAFIGSFPWTAVDYPCWTFTTGVGTGGKYVGEATSHELGHTLGLTHDGTATATYYTGHDNWAPIMGASYYKPITQWSKGEYPGANNQQDDLAIISGTTNGVGYRNSDHSPFMPDATPMVIQPGGNVAGSLNSGIIERTGDVDVFSFTTTGGMVNLDCTTVLRHTDLKLSLTLNNAQGFWLGNFDAQPGNLCLPVKINMTLPAGTYYIVVSGPGYAATDHVVYSNYGSLGVYSFSGNIPNTYMGITAPGNNTSIPEPLYNSLISNAADHGSLKEQMVYPNPATDELNINTGIAADKYDIDITNCLGKLVYSTTTSEKRLKVTVSGYAAGTYFVKIKGMQSGSSNTFKVVKK